VTPTSCKEHFLAKYHRGSGGKILNPDDFDSKSLFLKPLITPMAKSSTMRRKRRKNKFIRA